MHISFASERKTFVGIVLLVDLFWFTLRMSLWVSQGRTWRKLKTSLFAFSFIWITLVWRENVSEIISRFWKVSPFCGFYSAMFSVFVILTKYLLKTFATLCFSDTEHFFFSFYVIFWSYCEPFSFLSSFRTRFRCFLYAFRSSSFPFLFVLFLSLDLSGFPF